MERDFLGAMWRPERPAAGEAEPSGYLGAAPPMQWQFPAKAAAAPAFMAAFRSAREEDSKEAVFDHFSRSGFRPPPAGDAYDGIRKQASPVPPHHQRRFGLDGQVNPQQHGGAAAAAAHGHRAQGMDSYGVAAHHHLGGSRIVQAASMPPHPVPYNAANPAALRVQSLPDVAGGGSPFKNQSFTESGVVGMYGGPRGLRDPKSMQMTIFYNGLVNVFDNIPVEKAQELVLLASRAAVPNPPSSAHKSDSPIPAMAKVMVPAILPARQIIIQKPEPSVPGASGITSPIHNVSQPVIPQKSTSSSNNDAAGPKPASDVPPVSQASSSQTMPLATTTAAAIMPRAVPQARKASLARFLEKRKERVSTVVLYPSSKSPLESSDTVGSASAPSKSSCTDIAPLSNNGEEPMCLGQPRNDSFSSAKHPSTMLHI